MKSTRKIFSRFEVVLYEGESLVKGNKLFNVANESEFLESGDNWFRFPRREYKSFCQLLYPTISCSPYSFSLNIGQLCAGTWSTSPQIESKALALTYTYMYIHINARNGNYRLRIDTLDDDYKDYYDDKDYCNDYGTPFDYIVICEAIKTFGITSQQISVPPY